MEKHANQTVIIHPKDESTDFLSKAYDGKMNTIVIRNKISDAELKQHFAMAERIVLMGHGLPSGLLGFDSIYIDSKYVQWLKNKEVFYVWCNANKFVLNNNLKGFCTGMIISDKEEASDYNINVTDEELSYSNDLFANAIGHIISLTEYDVKDFGVLYKGNSEIIKFNRGNVWKI